MNSMYGYGGQQQQQQHYSASSSYAHAQNPAASVPGRGAGVGGAHLNVQRYDIKKHISFDREKRQGPIIIVVGKRGTGKSLIIKDICWHFHKDIKNIRVMSGTESCSPFFSEFVPPMCITDGYQPNLASKIVANQFVRCKDFYAKLSNGDRSAAHEDHRLLWIIDDCMYDDSWARTELMRFIFTCGRHVKIFLIVTMQYPLGIPPALRGNIDAVFMTRDIGSSLRRLYDTYGSAVFETYEEFKLIFNQLTQDFRAMVLALNKVNAPDLMSLVYYFKAEERNFRMGRQEDWDESARIANDYRRKIMDTTDEYGAAASAACAGGNRRKRPTAGGIHVFPID